jgi:hypothetical protein
MVDEFKMRLEKTTRDLKIRGVKLSSTDSTVTFIPPIINGRIALDLEIVALAGYAIYTIQDKVFYLIPILFVCCVLAATILMHSLPINRVEFDFFDKTLRIRNRNIINRLYLKYILRMPVNIPFPDIKAFRVRSNDSFEITLLRFYIDLYLVQGNKYVALTFRNEGQALTICAIFNSIKR